MFDRSVKQVPGIDINEEQQLMLMEKLSTFYAELPFRDTPFDGMRSYSKNGFFDYGDGIILYSMIRQFKPTRIIEVGSGFSSALNAEKIGSLMPLFKTNGLGVLHQGAYRPFSSLWIMNTA